ncbi:MAG: KOW domain-containing RNA-binding protein [Oscillospiraceae bacterium]|nr:KOW domain-containing RNA-binding protein [Oscillospiraceae bacterium]
MIQISDLVRSKNGRDAGKTFFVIGADGEMALIADGRARRLENPKRKKVKHLEFLAVSSGRTAEKLRQGERVTNSEIRRAIADFSESSEA